MPESALEYLPALLGFAWLLPLASFTAIVLVGPRMGKAGVLAGYVATGAIAGGMLLSLVALAIWIGVHPPGGDEAHAVGAVSGTWYTLSPPGIPEIGVGYYIDALTVTMFAMVTLIATCIHFYSMGYMHEELHDVTDHEVTLEDGKHLHRPGRYYRFFQYLSLFCFSMLGLVIAGNIAMVFVFWELVGICSYFLIGFYIERQSASNAANKAFIVNRIGDFGMIIGLMALWGGLGTFAFGDTTDENGQVVAHGIFSQVRPEENDHQLQAPAGMVAESAREQVAATVGDHRWMEGDERVQAARSQFATEVDTLRNDPENHWGYALLVVAGIGIFCGCVGKSAQFPLHVWLPDAMEGPTPVSALVHSATMVAAGVYLVGRFFPVFTPEVLLVIAIVGCITLFMAATIAITATDIKRVLAYSTVSQLGYMMLALGVGGWIAGLFHLITHAFFKSLLFLCSGSVIHACHTNEMTQMGGLRRKMPYTAYTMLAGCLAIAGAPFFSGFYSKDSIIIQAMHFGNTNPSLNFLLYAAVAGAAITAFYMFRLWFMTFAGEPRDAHVWEHVHESPKVMWVPLVILAFFAVVAGWEFPLSGISVTTLLDQALPFGVEHGAGHGVLLSWLHYPSEHDGHHLFHTPAMLMASGAALAGFLLAVVMYGRRWISADEVSRQFAPLYRFLRGKWYFDELYNAMFVKPVLFISRLASRFDKGVLDWLIDNSARLTVRVSADGDQYVDRMFVDGLANYIALWIHSGALWLRRVQTGRLRQYVMFIVVGTVALFMLLSFWVNNGGGGAIGGH